MKTAVIYARYSSERQTEQSIEGQLRVCNEYAARNNIVILDTYIDRATTGTNDHRPAFQQMLQDSDKHSWDMVLVYKLDRFSRNKYEMATHRKHLRDNGIKLVSSAENIPEGPEGIILESMLEGMAEYYSAELSQKVRRGLNESRHKGQYTGGYLLYGYKVVDKKIVIDEDKAPIVQAIFHKASLGLPVTDILAYLNEIGAKNRGKPFARNTVYNMLKNPKYTGTYVYDDEEFDNIYPQIVDKDTFEIVSRRVAANRHAGRKCEVVYLLKKKLFCGYCGSPITADCGTGDNGKRIRYYNCAKRKHKGTCKKSVLRKEYLEECVLDIIAQAFKTKENIDLLADMLLEEHNKRVVDQSKLQLLEKNKTKIMTSIDNMLLAIEQGIVTISTKTRLDELEQQLVEIENNINKEKNRLSIGITKKDIVSFIRKSLKKDDKQMIDMLVNKIILYDDKIEVYFNFTKNSGDNQGSLFYKDFTKMPCFNQFTQEKEYRNMELLLLYIDF